MNPLSPLSSATSWTLFQLYQLTGNMGLAIIGLTLVIRFLLLPLTASSLKAQKKMQKLQPELKELKNKHKDNKTEFQKAQMELYKKYNINPLSGCLPYIVQIVFLIVLYQVLLSSLKEPILNGIAINTRFFWLDLRTPDQFFILPILAGLTQFILSLMILPGIEQHDIVPNNSKNKAVQEKNKKEEDVIEMGMAMQKQMVFLMPLMTTFIAWRFQSGLGLYWVTTTLFSVVQQYFVSGPGGIKSYAQSAYLRVLSVVKK